MSYEIIYGLSIRPYSHYGEKCYVIGVKHDCSDVSPKDPYWTYIGEKGYYHYGRIDPEKCDIHVMHSRSEVFEPFKNKEDAEMYIIKSYASGEWQQGNNKYAKALTHAKPSHWYSSSFDYSLIHACRSIGFNEYANKISERLDQHFKEYQDECIKNLVDALNEGKQAPKGKFLVKFVDPIYPKMKELEVSYLAKISSAHIWRHNNPDKAKVYSDFYQAVKDAKRWVKHNHENCGHIQLYAEIVRPDGTLVKEIRYEEGE